MTHLLPKRANSTPLVAAIGNVARVAEFDELARRVAALEGVKNGKS